MRRYKCAYDSGVIRLMVVIRKIKKLSFLQSGVSLQISTVMVISREIE